MKREAGPTRILIAAAIISAAGLALTTTALVWSILADRTARTPEELDRNLAYIERLFTLQMAGAPLLASGLLLLIIWGVWAKRQSVAIGVILAAAVVFGTIGYAMAGGAAEKLAAGVLEKHRALITFGYVVMHEFTSPLIFLVALASALLVFAVTTRSRPKAGPLDWSIVIAAAAFASLEAYALARILAFLTKVSSFFGPVR